MQLAKLVHDMESLQEALAELALAGDTIALVPTMGALHAGHVALVRHAATLANQVVITIFVNPKQFGPNEDFAKYPRTLEADLAAIAQEKVAIVYAPSVEDLYPEGFSTSVSVGEVGTILCGKSRPGHFDGVATVVTKLLMRTLPQVAVFGEKDYQQLCIIRQLVDDLDIGVGIEGLETVREEDGLAMSSRNRYLSAPEREIAPILYKTLQQLRDAMAGGAVVESTLVQGKAALEKAGFIVDYLELRDAYSLKTVEYVGAPARLLVAAWLGTTRLIDNIAVG